VYALASAGATVIVSNRTFVRAVSLASAFGCIPLPWEARTATEADIMVNATSIGMTGTGDQPADARGDGEFARALPFPPEKLRSSMIVMECVHTPEETPLVRAARARHCEVITGVDLFKAQARFQWQLFCDSI
jgi:shikimate 5-dehydrogenase